MRRDSGDPRGRGMSARLLRSRGQGGEILLESLGDWTAETMKDVPRELERLASRLRDAAIVWDVSGVGSLDSAGMMVFIHYLDRFAAAGCRAELAGADSEFEELYQLLRPLVVEERGTRPGLLARLSTPFHALGVATVGSWRELRGFLDFVGENFTALMIGLRHPSTIRYRAIIKNIEDAGVRALPIIALTSFLIGVVIAYQGAVQLQKFGANIFIVDMIGISVTRELAPLITAIVVAGRTGSSFTAQIGAMKITEEISAMRIMGFEPHRFLVLPRIVALMIALPLMIFFADIIGIVGGMVVSATHLNISPGEFVRRLQNVLDVKHVWIGILKGPFFAWLIAMTGCFRGFQVSSNTESIGRYTTISVVNAIFLVIACDALFSIVFTELGI